MGLEVADETTQFRPEFKLEAVALGAGAWRIGCERGA